MSSQPADTCVVASGDREALVPVALLTTVPASLGFFRGLPAYLRTRGYDVAAIAAPGPDLDAFAEREGVKVYGVPMTRQITPRTDILSVVRLTRTLTRLRPTIVHASTPKGGLLGMLAARLTRRPIRVFHLHGLPHQTRTGPGRILLQGATRIACTLADQVLCVSESLRTDAIADGIVRADKAIVLLNGSANGVDAEGQFDPERFGPDPRATGRAEVGLTEAGLVVGFVGRLAHDKGIDDLAAAWQIVRESRSDVRLLMVGPEEPEDPTSTATLTALQRDDRVRFTGQVADPAAALAAMDVLILPTYREGFGNVLIEAGAMGRPVVATTVTGCVDAVQHNVTGLLVPPHDPPALAAAIQRYLDDPALRTLHGAAGRARALRDFRPAAIQAALANCYDDLLARRRLPTPRR